jgi:hypothetical protein
MLCKGFVAVAVGYIALFGIAVETGFRIQEKAYSGLDTRVTGRLCELTDSLASKSRIHSEARRRFKPGTRLVREWKGTIAHHLDVALHVLHDLGQVPSILRFRSRSGDWSIFGMVSSPPPPVGIKSPFLSYP